MPKKEAPVITTERLTMRRLTEADIPLMSDMFSDKLTVQFLTGDTPPCDGHSMLKLVRARRETEWAVINNETDEFIGVVLVTGITQGYLGELGCVLRSGFWKKGYAKEASLAVIDYCKNTLSLKRLCARIDNENAAAKKAAESLGFELNAVLPEANFVGRVCDIAYYSRMI